MIENYLNTQGYMLFDGAFGTYCTQRYAEDQKPCEMANLNHQSGLRPFIRSILRQARMPLRRTPFPRMNSIWNAAGR